MELSFEPAALRRLAFPQRTPMQEMSASSTAAYGKGSLKGFFTRSLAHSAMLLFGLVTLITVSCSGYDYFLIEQEKSVSLAKRDHDEKSARRLMELVGLQKQILLDVIELRHYLADFSATRGLDGKDSDLENAAKIARRFPQDISEAKQAARLSGNPDLLGALSDVERRFPEYYERGLEMTKVYAEQGTAAGNKAMESFDHVSEDIQKHLTLSSAALEEVKQHSEADAASARVVIDQLRDRATTVALAGVIITALTCIIGILVIGRWVIQPLGWLTFAFKKLSDGDHSLVVSEEARSDEIGDLARVYANFRQVTIERQQAGRETRLLSELNAWLQCCKSLEELYDMVGNFVTLLLPDCGGSLYIYANSRDILDNVKAWNGARLSAPMQPDECWGLRRGRTFTHECGDAGIHCSHVDPSAPGDYCCIPILAHGDTIGMLHIEFKSDQGAQEAPLRKALIAEQRRIGLTCAEHISMAIANVKLRDQLRDQSIRDPLTGLFNRRYLMDTCRREFSRARRMRLNVSILSIDVDYFKRYNDNHGHDAGDTVLRAVGDCLENSFRNEDVACRFGGEEFVVVLLGATPAIALRKANELRDRIESLMVNYLDKPLPRITASIGVASFPEAGDTPEAVLRAADEALYRAKESGRNRVELSRSVNIHSDASKTETDFLKDLLSVTIERVEHEEIERSDAA